MFFRNALKIQIETVLCVWMVTVLNALHIALSVRDD